MRMRSKTLLFVMVAVFYVLHQDSWNWRRIEPLFLGVLPVGLAYHVAYSVAASVIMAILVKFAWPRHLETIQPESNQSTPASADQR